MTMLASKDFIVAKIWYRLWGSAWWSLDQVFIAYPSELSWHVIEGTRRLDPCIVMLFWFWVNHLSPKSEVMYEQKSV